MPNEAAPTDATPNDAAGHAALPLSGLKVVEFTHMVMGPAVGLVLGDLGADVVKVEPMAGDNTRRLMGSGAGYFPMYNRNKRSVCLDLKSPEGREAALRLIAQADVLVENFRPGAMEALGFGEAAMAALNPGLVYCSAKGFLSGPYEHRAALDEVAQMMGGLAYMTGPPGRPLRAGSSVIDVMGGLFGVIGVLAALIQRGKLGRGQTVKSALFENCVFMVGQHMAQKVVTGVAPRPMPVRISAWAIYDLFTTRDGEQVFVGVVTDGQWQAFCKSFGLEDLLADETLARNTGRVQARDRLVPRVQALFADFDKADLLQRLEAIGLPFAPINRPEDLFDDAHLNAAGGLLDLTLPDDRPIRLPALPVELDGQRPGVVRDLAKPGEHTREVLAGLGYGEAEVADLLARGLAAG
ncbi:CaiB/BaiF CoA transferase family protein [Nitrospirillum pindoramense]|uniref:Crotonobetainyl-CoA:carnitine CoA-transferase CaiB-like acyl-CoA transferase n=1 Tax=Nitrospirillum amazonense TaxID=28077 RepID=A0A560HHI1_9PROT|nr:CaiB/BaiF CoA-transferase family protein [Nitrospirillum amazonense]TWB45895.1 crotonobetainyl-CoA:carnitine CoA-transferase CaiB-like acyl-CoA transferase [Nitrospirillum amazonense]